MSQFGRAVRVSTSGESHCAGVGCIVEGIPSSLPLSPLDIQKQLDRRRPGQSAVSTKRNEKDQVQIQSGTEMGITLGTPIGLFVPNEDQRPGDYKSMDDFPRPSHADFTYLEKYGVKASSGGGRASARETIGRVAAGAIAEKYLKLAYGIEIVAFVSAVGPISFPYSSELLDTITREQVDQTIVRCPDLEYSKKMEAEILQAKEEKDSVGGVVTCVCRKVGKGWGEPCFDKLEALFAHAMLSIPATKGFEIGSGFAGSAMRGSAHNDPFVKKGDSLGTSTNNSGGIQGGISNGENIYFRVGFKPPATIGSEQKSSTYEGEEGVLEAKGRHDPCVVARAVPIVEAMAALVLIDVALLQEGRKAATNLLPKQDIPERLSKRQKIGN